MCFRTAEKSNQPPDKARAAVGSLTTIVVRPHTKGRSSFRTALPRENTSAVRRADREQLK